MSQDYRYYRLDAAGHLYEAEWLDAESDEHAITQIETQHPNDNCEIWQGERLVAKLPARRLSA